MHLPARHCFDQRALYWLSISSGVRINQQGLTFYDSPVKHTTESYDCPRTIGALCSHGIHTFFRCTDMPATVSNDAPSPFQRFWQMEGCRGKTPTLDLFDVMPCDLGEGTALIWTNNRISVQYNMDLPYWPTLFISLIVVWLVINMGESAASILRVSGSDSHGKVTSALCIILVILVLIYTPGELWITDRERWIYIFTLIYITAYSFYHLVNPHTINMIAGCLVLITARFYQHNDTPYAAGFLFLIATRLIQKIYVTCFSGEDDLYQYTRIGFMVMDVVFLVLINTESLQNAYADSMHGQLSLVGVLFTSWAVGKLLAEYIAFKNESLLL
jgi:hypothetical protein